MPSEGREQGICRAAASGGDGGVRVEAVAPEDPRWDPFVLACPEATFFHRAGWARVIARTFGYRPYSLLACREGRVTGVLPLALVHSFPVGRALLSTPLGVYGGVAADDGASAEALLRHAQELGARLGVRYVELRGGRTFPSLPSKDLYVTFRKEIDPDPDVNLARIPQNQRRSIRVSKKRDLTHRLGGQELVDDFHDIFARSVRNLGTPVFPKALFRNLLDEFGSSCAIHGVYQAGRMVSGVLTFFDRECVLPYYGGAVKRTSGYSVNDYMYWSLLCLAAERGCRIFDFGRSKRGTGSFDFKRHWGFQPTPLTYQFHLIGDRSVPDLSPSNPRFSLAIQAWRLLPLPLTKWIGPAIVRYFP